jgi:hypothetical protein
MMVPQIQEKIRLRRYEFSKHALDQSILRNISVSELEQAMLSPCEIVEDYPHDKYGPSCLLLGFTNANRPLHVLCSYPTRPYLKIITIYEPDPSEWMNNQVRRK